jgi:pimeloyl-ACP methyl ester carboxylesterase
LVFGSARGYLPRARPFAQAGYRVRVVDYPLGNYPGAKSAMSRAIRELRQQRGEGHKVYLVGESTGGTLVQDAAARHRVRKAVAIAPVSDFTTWAAVPHEAYPLVLRMDARRASPIYYKGKPRTQVRVFHSRADDIVPYEQSVRYTRRKGGRLRELRGGHLADQSWIPRVIRAFDRDSR